MILPTDDECRRVVALLSDEPTLTDFEESFINSNMDRTEFTDKQRTVVAFLKEKYACD